MADHIRLDPRQLRRPLPVIDLEAGADVRLSITPDPGGPYPTDILILDVPRDGIQTVTIRTDSHGCRRITIDPPPRS